MAYELRLSVRGDARRKCITAPVAARVYGLRASLLTLCVLVGLVGCEAEITNPHDYLVRLKERSGAPGVSAAVAVNGRIVFSEGIGSADVESGLLQTGTTVHNIGSVSKVLTTVAVMQLVEQGKVQLDAEIQRYAPWFPRKGRPITLRQILTHTSGIRHYRADELTRDNSNILRHYETFEESTRFWRDDPLLFAPGARYAYSSFAFDLLQAVIESASSEPFEQYMRRHVFGPAGMVDTQFDVSQRKVSRRGWAYTQNKSSGRFQRALNEDVSYKYAGGGMLSTDEDLCKFGHALNTGVLLKPASIAAMYRLQLPKNLQRFKPGSLTEPPPAASQALGFRISADSHGHVHVGHPGTVKGTVSNFFDYFEEDVTVAVYANYDDKGVNLADYAEGLAALFYAGKRQNSQAAVVSSSVRHLCGARVNQFLTQTTAQRLTTECRDNPWVRRISERDVIKLMRRLAVEASYAKFIEDLVAKPRHRFHRRLLLRHSR